MAAAPLYAQRFQETFGSSNPAGEEGNAVISASNGDFISAGVTNASGVPEMLVIRTDANGSAIWSYSYQFPYFQESGATDVKEFPNGDLAVVGWGRYTPGTTPLGVVMRLDAGGSPLWGRSFWINLSNTTLQSVAITQYGNGSTTFADDIIFSGYTFPYSGAPSDALLGRMDGNGTMIWCRVYDHPFSQFSTDDRLYGIDESRIVSPSGTIGDIVATGVVSDIAAGLPEKVLVMRVNGNNGTYTASSHGSSMFGGDDYDMGYSIQELRYGGNPGDLIITGATTSRPSPSSGLEAFLLQITPEPCAPYTIRADRYLGDNGGSTEAGFCVREITAVGTTGNIVVGGITKIGAIGAADGFLQEYQEGTLNPASITYFYGDGGDDEIRSFAESYNASNTPGFIAAGVTSSSALMPPSNTRNLWLPRNNANLDNICAYTSAPMSDAPASWWQKCINPVQKDDVIVMHYFPSNTSLGWNEYQLCYSPFKTAMPGADPAGTSAPAGVTLASYPNPVRREDGITLEYSLAHPGVADITVIDALGRTMFRKSADRAAGGGTETVPTAGWSAGTYLARITVDGVSATSRIVLLEK